MPDPHDEDAVTGRTTADDAASIRERQRRRRDAARQRLDVSAFLGTPAGLADPNLDADLDADLEMIDSDDEEEDESGSTPPPMTGQVWIVFRSVSWADADATLRESDSLVGVFSTEAGAKNSATALDRDSGGDAEHWYQPYTVSD